MEAGLLRLDIRTQNTPKVDKIPLTRTLYGFEKLT
jgi:hypothetical protein